MDVPEVNPSPAGLQRVAVAVRCSQLQALPHQSRPGNRPRPALAADRGLRIACFASLPTSGSSTSHDPSTCLQVMRRNMAGLNRAFAP